MNIMYREIEMMRFLSLFEVTKAKSMFHESDCHVIASKNFSTRTAFE